MDRPTLPLTPQDLELLRPLPWHQRATHLLTGQCGPLQGDSAAYSDDLAGLAYLLRLVWRLARKQDQYQKLAVYEARERFGARVRSEASASGDMREFGARLLRKVGATMDQLQQEDLLWWRTYTTTKSAGLFRDRTRLDEALAGCHLVHDWLYQLGEALRDTGPDPATDAETESTLTANHADALETF